MLLVSQRCSYHVCAIDMTLPVPIMRVILHCVDFELSELLIDCFECCSRCCVWKCWFRQHPWCVYSL